MPLDTISQPGASRRVSVRRVLLALVALTLLLYGSAIVWLITQETRIVFQAGRLLGELRPAFPYEQIDIPREDSARQFAWMMPLPSTPVGPGPSTPLRPGPEADAPWVLFLHGNAATIASRTNIAHYNRLRGLRMHVLAPEYRGFGGLDGVPTERSLITDARAGYDYLRTRLHAPPECIIIYGWSLGSAVAVALAADAPSGAVILEGAPASLVAIGQQQYPWFPIRLLMRNPFESIRRVDRIRAPMLFLHSPEDVVIPIGEARRLYDAVDAPKAFVEVRGGHVYASEMDADAFYGAVERFLTIHRVLPIPATAGASR